MSDTPEDRTPNRVSNESKPWVLRRLERHPGGATFYSYLQDDYKHPHIDGGADGHHAVWGPFGTAEKLWTAREVNVAYKWLEMLGGEPWTYELRGHDAVLKERMTELPEALKEQIADFVRARPDDPQTRTALETIGRLRMIEKQNREAAKESHPTSQDGDWQVLRPSSTLTVNQVLEGRGGMGIA